jgi:hypothetical protein
MSNLFESLESRMLLSAVPAVTTLHTDEAAVKTALTALKKDGASAIKAIAADLKAAKLQVTDKAQIKALSTDLSAVTAGDSKAIAAATAKVNADANKLEAAEAQLAKKPGNVTLTAKVSADQTTLTTDAAAKLSAFNAANSGASVIVDLNAIVADGGAPGTDAATANTTLSADASAVGVAATQAFSTDVSAIVGP